MWDVRMIVQSEFTDIINNPLFGILGIIIGLTSITLAIILYYKGKKEKKPVYELSSYNVVGDLNKYGPLEISYAGQKIDNVTMTKLKFWNEGRETIHFTDIAKADPITLSIKPNNKILDTSLVESKNPANEFSFNLEENDSRIKLIFDYLDNNDGGTVRILHTGLSNEDFKLSGSIKGAGRVKEKKKPRLDPNYLIMAIGAFLSGVVIGVITEIIIGFL